MKIAKSFDISVHVTGEMGDYIPFSGRTPVTMSFVPETLDEEKELIAFACRYVPPISFDEMKEIHDQWW